jgi:hypothetical protein
MNFAVKIIILYLFFLSNASSPNKLYYTVPVQNMFFNKKIVFLFRIRGKDLVLEAETASLSEERGKEYSVPTVQ